MPTIAQLIRRIADYYIKFHLEYLLRFDRMYPLISMGFQFVPSLVFDLGCTAEQTFAVLPAMRYPLISNITAGVLKKRDGILAVGILGTIHTSPGEKAGQFSDCDAIQLLVENVVDAFLQIRDFLFQPLNQPFGNFPQKHPRLTGWVEKCCAAVMPQFFRQHIQHPVCYLRWCEHLIVGQIRQTGEDIRIIHIAVKITHNPAPSCNRSADIP